MPRVQCMALGSGGVGKSSLIIRFIANQFVDAYDPTFADSYRKRMCVDDTEYLMDFFDSAGEETQITQQCMRSSEGFMFVYSITSRSSFEEINSLRELVLAEKDLDWIPCVLVGNKCDVENERCVTYEEGKKLADTFGCPFFETSAKDRINVDDAFHQMIREVAKVPQPNEPPPPLKKNSKCVVS